MPIETRHSHHSVRLWPLLVIALLEAAAWIVIRHWPELSHQQMNIFCAQAIFYGFVLVLLWLVLLSRLAWKRRLLILGSVVCLIGATAALFRIRGVSGDLLPILEWRFARRSAPLDAPPSPTPETAPAAAATSAAASATQDYPQFLGPHRDGMVPDPGLETNWLQRPPKLIWRRPVGAGWSGFAIRGGLAVTQEQHGDQEAVVCYELASGNIRWSHLDLAHYQTTIAGEGPRANPSIAGSRVFTMGATGLLNCLDLASGQVVWSKNVPQDNGGQIPEWGVSCSPLVLPKVVIVTTGAGGGRSLAAYENDTGARIWTAGRDTASYASPVLLSLNGVEQVVLFNSSSVTGHDMTSGKVLWEHPWPSGQPHIATPVTVATNQLLVSSGYGVGSELLSIEHSSDGHWSASRLWKSIRLKSKFANVIPLGAFIYGLDDGIMVCLQASTGDLKWKDGRYGHGQMICTGDLLLVMAESGELVLVLPAPDAHREVARFRVLPGKTWNPPALAGNLLLVRNDLEAACYELPKRKAGN